jgi:hypothetical protein
MHHRFLHEPTWAIRPVDAGRAFDQDGFGSAYQFISAAAPTLPIATTKPRRSKGSKLEADEGSNLNAD